METQGRGIDPPDEQRDISKVLGGGTKLRVVGRKMAPGMSML